MDVDRDVSTAILCVFIANILSPLTGKSDYSVINSMHFVSTISHEKVHDNGLMVPFDVESLFKNALSRVQFNLHCEK